MNVSWCLVDAVSRLLEAGERDAVRGDLAELRTTGPRALGEVLGLVTRRQLGLWLHWRPWLALAVVVLPIGMLLSFVTRAWAAGNAIYAWLYVNNWTWTYLESPGARHDLAHYSTGLVIDCLTLVCWSWTSGFMLGSLSRRATWITGALFCLAVFTGTIGSTTTGQSNPGNAIVFSLAFYRWAFPVIFRGLFVVLPALWGLCTGVRSPTLGLIPSCAWALVITALTFRSARGLEGSVIFGWIEAWRSLDLLRPGPDGMVGTADDLIRWPVRLLPFVMVWPAICMLAMSTQSALFRGRGSLEPSSVRHDS